MFSQLNKIHVLYDVCMFLSQRLVKACGEVKAAPTEKEEIEFLCTVCAKIKTDPYLVNFFLEVNLCFLSSQQQTNRQADRQVDRSTD